MNTDSNPTPKSIHSIYTFYLSPDHVGDQVKTVTIAQAEIKMIYNAHANKELPEVVLHFKEARRSLKCNKTQTEAMWDLTGTDDFNKWTGTRVTLSTVKTKGGKMTIKISKPEE